MKDYTISELIALGKSAERFFDEKLGYTDVCFLDVTLWPNGSGHVFYFSLQDDFQKELHYDKRFECGSMISIPLEDFWNTIEQWPNREQRELEIMARKLAALDANLDQIQSAQVLAFVARLQPQIDEIRRMITHQPDDEEMGMEAPVFNWPEKNDDEIPF